MRSRCVRACVLLGLMWGCGGGEDEPAQVEEMGPMMPLPRPDLGGGADMGKEVDFGTPPPPDLGSDMVDKPLPDMSEEEMTVPPVDMSGEDMGGGEDMAAGVDMSGGPMCGNGVLESGELCDGNCPMSCDDGDACTDDILAGSAATCDALCVNQPKNAMCGAADGCCPSGCMVGDDPDCVARPIDCRDPSTWPAAWAALEQAALAEINMRRAAGGTCGMMSFVASGPLALSAQLQIAARCHSLDMATRNYFGSASPEGTRVGERVQMTGYMYRLVGQNVGTASSASVQVTSWIGSNGCHHIMNPDYDDIGIGYVEDLTGMNMQNGGFTHYWTMVAADRP